MGAARAYLLPMMKPNTMKTRMIVPATATTAMMMTGFCSLDMTVAAIKRQINNTRCQIYSCKFVYKIQEFCIPVFYKRNFVLIFHAHFPHFFQLGYLFCHLTLNLSLFNNTNNLIILLNGMCSKSQNLYPFSYCTIKLGCINSLVEVKDYKIGK